MNFHPDIKWGLAPMEGVTELSFRILIALAGPPAWMTTPFLRATETYPRELPIDYMPELGLLSSYVPYQLIPQVMGSNTEELGRACDLILKDAPFVDLNCGCPSKTVVGNRSGSSLLQDVDYFAAFLERLVTKVGSSRLSVKMRTGFDDAREFDALSDVVSILPLERITVHGRTRLDRYTGKAKHSFAEELQRKIKNYSALKENASDEFAISNRVVPKVVASGDVIDFLSSRALKEAAPSINHAIVGRGALRNPWIFATEYSPLKAAPVKQLLSAYYYLELISLWDEGFLVDWIKDGWLLNPCGFQQESWCRVVESLENAARGRGDPSMARKAQGRMKMLWNYLRSSLPKPFLDPMLLRASTHESFMGALDTLASQEGLNADALPVIPDASFNWMYAGEPKSN